MKISFLMKLANFPSISACIINNDQVIWSNSYGYYDLKNKKESNSDTIYVIASITKTVVGTALMQLWEKNLFELDEDVVFGIGQISMEHSQTGALEES